jgi:hypothetical protein
MPTHVPRPPSKTRTREHVIADLSINHTERVVLLCGHTLEEFENDYGLDLMMYTYDEGGALEEDLVFFQVKATDVLKVRADGRGVVFRVARADLESWLRQTFPVILVVYDAQADVAYWLYVQAHFRQPGVSGRKRTGATVTLHVPRENVLNVQAVRRFRDFKAAVRAQVRGVTHGEG